MPLPHNGTIDLARIVDADGNPAEVVSVAGVYRLRVESVGGGGGGVTPVSGDPGATITTNPDVAVGGGATVPLFTTAAIPAGSRRVTVQVTGGDSTTRVRIREIGAAAGSGKLLDFLGSTIYGGADGAIEGLEAQNVAGPATTVAVQFEGD